MAKHENLIKITNGKEELMQQGLIDYLSSNPACLFKDKPYNLPMIVDRMFDYLDYANSPDVAANKDEFQGNSVRKGMVMNFMEAFKVLFLDSRDSLGKINMDRIQKDALQHAYDALHSGMESYGVLVALRNGFIRKLDPNRYYTLGAYVNDVSNRLQDRCRFTDNSTLPVLLRIINIAALYRNNKDHTNTDKSYLWTHIFDMLMFMCAGVHIGYLLWQARNGGVRYQTDVNGKLTLYYKDKRISIDAPGRDQSTPQFTPVYQLNLPERWAEEFNCRLEFRDAGGKLLDTKRFDVKGNSFCSFKYQPPKEAPKLDLEEEELSVPRVKTFVKESELKGRSWLDGEYVGPVDEEGKPNGKGIYRKGESSYSGRFEHGKPAGIFTIKCNRENSPVVYNGTVTDKLEPNEGFLKYLDEDKSFEGTFEGWGLKKGTKLRGGKLAYEGEFENFPAGDGGSYNLYHGQGKLYGDGFIYEGEFAFGQMSGEGTMTYAEPEKPGIHGIWSDGVLIKVMEQYPKEQPVQVGPPADGGLDGPQVKEDTPEPDGPQVKNEDSEIEALLATVLLELPAEPFHITDPEGKEWPYDVETQSVEAPCGTVLTAVLESDERVAVTHAVTDDPFVLEQWDIASAMANVLAALPAIAGSGQLSLPGGVYEGEWNWNKQPHGKGTLKMNNGDVYTGDFADGLYDGQGELKTALFTYTGGFKTGRYHGTGTTLMANGDRLVGTYDQGKKDGVFTRTTAHGKVSRTEWSKGELIS